jgi:hypothetical protein
VAVARRRAARVRSLRAHDLASAQLLNYSTDFRSSAGARSQ